MMLWRWGFMALYQAGLQVGHDMAVVGYDDIELAQFLSPALTTICQPKDSLGELAVDTLLDRIKHPDREPQRLVLNPELTIRDSVGQF